MSLDGISVALSAGIGYVLGSLSFGYWVAKANGVDIFAVGSRSPGATNVKRSIGKGPGNLVFVLDFLKGLAATGWPLIVYSKSPSPEYYALIGLFGGIVGHSFSVLTRFRGGKGVATYVGILFCINIYLAVIFIIVWFFVFVISKYSSLASMIASLFVPLSSYFLFNDINYYFYIILFSLILITHRENIKRLKNNTESKTKIY